MFEYKTQYINWVDPVPELEEESSRGWELITATPVTDRPSTPYRAIFKRELENVKKPPPEDVSQDIRHYESYLSMNKDLEHKLKVAKAYLERISLEDRVEQGHTVSTNEACLASDCLKLLEKM